jgi:hypothetical protein
VRDYLGQPQTDAGKKAQTLGEILPFALGAAVAMRHMAGKAMGPIADTLGSYMRLRRCGRSWQAQQLFLRDGRLLVRSIRNQQQISF